MWLDPLKITIRFGWQGVARLAHLSLQAKAFNPFDEFTYLFLVFDIRTALAILYQKLKFIGDILRAPPEVNEILISLGDEYRLVDILSKILLRVVARRWKSGPSTLFLVVKVVAAQFFPFRALPVRTLIRTLIEIFFHREDVRHLHRVDQFPPPPFVAMTNDPITDIQPRVTMVWGA